MTIRLRDVTRYVRSKNAGPFWVTIDIFFDGPDTYSRHRSDPAISPGSLASVLGVSADQMRRFDIDVLNAIKISYPRSQPQGGVIERDMHSGQQYASLLSLLLAA